MTVRWRTSCAVASALGLIRRMVHTTCPRNRATIIGETTGGGAHPGGGFRISEHFGMFVPTGRAISPITKTNWEGTGVTPDVAVPADQALLVARLMALKKQVDKVNPDLKPRVQGEIDRLEKELNSMKSKSE